MKAITIRQPWASLIAAGVKTVETRPRRTAYRGRIAIHAGLRFHEPFEEAMQACMAAGLSGFESIVLSAARAAPPLGPPRGAVVASARLFDCVPVENLINEPTCQPAEPWGAGHYIVDLDRERPLGDHSPGRWALLLDDIKPTTERCPACWGKRDARVIGRALATCPSCGRDRWHGTGSCECGAPGTACNLCLGESHCEPRLARGQQAVPWEWTP